MGQQREERVGQKNKARWIPQHSAGGVVIRHAGREAEFLSIMPAHRDWWQLPKGTIDAGEEPRGAALREVREEGGVDAEILADLGPIKFFYQRGPRRFVKTVDFFLMRYTGGDPANHDHEVSEARWFPLDQPEILAFESERQVVRLAAEALRFQESLPR